jgi:ABC-2 type transport system permease protein
VAGVSRYGFASRLARQQYAALAWARLRIFTHSMRSPRGGVDLSAGIMSYVVGLVIALGPSVGLGYGAWAALTQHHPLGVTAEFWAVCLIWQFLSAMAPALAGQNPEMHHLLRYPLSFGSWVLLYLLYGMISPSSIIGTLWCVAMGIGISLARPDLMGWAALVLAIFALFNLLLSRAILAWVERWMAQRRTREIVTGLFLFLALGAQMMNPAINHYNGKLPFGLKQTTVMRVSEKAMKLEGLFPPGVASASVLGAGQGENEAAAAGLGVLLLWMLAAGGALTIRLRAESRGENLSEAPRRQTARTGVPRRQRLNLSGPLGAVFEKDLRYLLRSGPMLYALAAPVVMVVLFSSTYRQGAFSSVKLEYALPLGLVWAFLGLTRLVYNNLGGEGEGIQLYFLSPTPARTVVLGKNALHATLFAMEAALIGGMIIFRFGWPAPSIAAATLAWLLFAVPANFAAGNTLSITMPYRVNLTRMRAERGSLGNGMLSMFIQLTILGVGAAVLVPFAFFGRPWLATPILLALAAGSLFAYLRVLASVNGMVERRRESLALEIMKAR